MKIPIKNIYYLLCYAWDCLAEKELVAVNSDDYHTLLDLFAKVLLNGCINLIKQGLDRNYLTESDTLTGIRGKIDIGVSIKKNLFITGRLYCHYDEFHQNILHNKIIKSILMQLLKTENLNQKLHNEIRSLSPKFDQIDIIQLTSKEFDIAQLQLHRNNWRYRFLLNVCRLIWENSLINEETGKYSFYSVAESDQKMGHLFETFIHNFYYIEQKQFVVKRDYINWNVIPIGDSSTDILPRMETDVSLQSQDKKIIIETKFYNDIFLKNKGVEKLRSNHMYQLFAYLSNIASRGGLNKQCEGILLYAETDKKIASSFQLGNHKLTIQSINLNQDWRAVHQDLLKIIE